MKKLTSIILAGALAAAMLPVNTFAADTDTYIDEPVTEEPLVHGQECTSILTISGSTATCKTEAKGDNTITEVYVNQTLYHMVSGQWVFYAHWSDHIYANKATVTNYAYSLPSGKYYLHSACTYIYPGGFEYTSKDSSTVTC